MTPEQLWKSLEPQVEEIERELMNRDAITSAMADAMDHGTGVFTVAVGMDFSSIELRTLAYHNMVVMGHPDQMQPTGWDPDIMIVDECEPLMTADVSAALEAYARSSRDSGRHQGVIVICDSFPERRLTQNHASTRRRAGSLALAALAMDAIAMPDISWLIKAEPPPGDPWHQKPLSKKNYAAPKQSFRGRMRSVNRNR